MSKLRFHMVDVFTDRAFGGNQLAVFPDGQSVPGALMQSVAREFNFSETTFVLPPQDPYNDFWVRIFTPASELPFAGHPTIGTAFVLARERRINGAGEIGVVRLEEGVGVIPVTVAVKGGAPDIITMDQPLPTFGATFSDREAIARLLSIAPDGVDARYPLEVVSCGLPFLFVPVTDLETLKRVKPRVDLWGEVLGSFEARDIYAFTLEAEAEGSTAHGRMFAPEIGIVEDPATGSANGPLGCYLVKHGIVKAQPAAHIVSEQGFEIGRPSFLYIDIEQTDDRISRVRVSGRCAYIGEGTLHI